MLAMTCDESWVVSSSRAVDVQETSGALIKSTNLVHKERVRYEGGRLEQPHVWECKVRYQRLLTVDGGLLRRSTAVTGLRTYTFMQ